MSKLVKQLEMDALRKAFGDVRNLVLLSISGLDAQAENQLRLALRKKNIRLQMIKNTLAARVFKDLGIDGLDPYLQGPTTVAWGLTGIAELSKEIDAWVRKIDKIKPKAAVADGTVVSFDQAKRFPTRAEALARVVGLALGAAGRLVAQLRSPGARLAGQLKAIREKASGETPPAEPTPASTEPRA